jgi:hypothetical protein
MINIQREEDEVIVVVGDTEAEVQDADEISVLAECSLEDLGKEVGKDYPEGLALQIHSEDGFKTYLFYEVHIVSGVEGAALEFVCHQPNKYWEGRFGLATLLSAVSEQVSHSVGFEVIDIDLEDDWKQLTLRREIPPDAPLADAILGVAAEINALVRNAEVALGGMRWKTEYETDESLFCTEVLLPLLRRMGFLSVRYSHGSREYGKDFTFSEMTPFGNLRHYGLQAKAGDISGKVNAAVDEVIGQLNDAFSMPYYELGSKEPRYISTFVVAISGRFAPNAKEKIAEKIPKGTIGSVYFLDKESILEFIDRYWARPV